jgi:hypothetical protein
MRKLRLDPEELSVEPFELETATPADGTVLANEVSGAGCPTSVQYSCGYPRTCGGTSCDTGYPVCYQCTGNCTA